ALALQRLYSGISAGQPLQPRDPAAAQAADEEARDQQARRGGAEGRQDARPAQDLFQRKGQGEARAGAGARQEAARQARDRKKARLAAREVAPVENRGISRRRPVDKLWTARGWRVDG